MANWIKRAAALLCAAAMALTCGCAGQNGSGETPAFTTAPVILQPTATPAPVKGGTLRLPMPVNADITDPLKVNTEEMLYLYSLVFESLLFVDSKGQLIPGLAENWACDETGAIWTIKLRSSARWQDTGAPITAADVVRHPLVQKIVTAYEKTAAQRAAQEAAREEQRRAIKDLAK